MGFRLPGIINAKRSLSRSLSASKTSKSLDIPKGYFAVYVGKGQKRFVIPVSYLNEPVFQDLLSLAEEEFGYEHPMGGILMSQASRVSYKMKKRLTGKPVYQIKYSRVKVKPIDDILKLLGS
ncbi:hypothetical protein ACLB2K_011625 [Fragaria x ananassa]